MRSHRYLLYSATILLTLTWLPLIIITVHRSVTVISGFRHLNQEELGRDGDNPDVNYWSLQTNFAEVSQRMEQRRASLKKACAEHGLDVPGDDPLHRPNAWEFLVNKRYNLIWCNVFKAASTSWLYNFNILAGYSPAVLSNRRIHLIELARRRYPRPKASELVKMVNISHTFIIVRHPFERLLSAYRDKILKPVLHSPHHKLGLQIIQTYRKKIPQKKGAHHFVRTNKPTFAEFVAYVIDDFKKDSGEMDIHWTPVTKFCTPCLIDFNIIMKFETLHEDSVYLIEKANLGHLIKPEWKNVNKELKRTRSLMHYYYSQLTEQQIRDLYQCYKYDFLIFEYSMKEFI